MGENVVPVGPKVNLSLSWSSHSNVPSPRLLSRSKLLAIKGSVVNAVDTAHGLHVGRSSLPCDHDTSVSTLRIGVVCQTWPCWAVPFSHLNFSLLWILVEDISFLSFVRRCYPNILVVGLDKVDFARLKPVDVVGINGPLGTPLVLPRSISILLLDWTCRRLSFPAWRVLGRRISHSGVGGVSDFLGGFMLAIHSSNWSSFLCDGPWVGGYPAADVGSLLDCRVAGAMAPDPGRLPTLSPPRVGWIGRSLHPRGLYPIQSVASYFLCPCVFSTSKWVRRQLSVPEKLGVFDIPVSFQKSWSVKESQHLLRHIRVPLKCHSAIVRGLFLDSDFSFGTGGGINTFSSLAPSSVPSTVPTSPSQLPSSWAQNIKHNLDEKAAKNDDAGIPVHFWNNTLAQDLGVKNLTTEQTTALDTLRSFVTRSVWVRSIVQCFCKYIRCETCHLHTLEHMFDFRPTPPTPFCRHCHKYNKNIKRLQCVKYNEGRYAWLENGKVLYRRWWNGYMQVGNPTRKREVEKDIVAGLDCISRARDCTEWKWTRGSRLFFWRWGKEFKDEVRDGARVFVQTKLPNCKDKQKAPKDPDTLKLVQRKLRDVRWKQYIDKGEVKSVTSFFDVPKGDGDIRMVYNATSSGLNDAVWAPWFSLPTVESHLRAVDPGTFMGDCDLGEMFLNFMLDINLVPYAGVDLTNIFPDELDERIRAIKEVWTRLLMGFRPSPYLTTRDVRRIEPRLKGRKDDPKSVFRWDKVKLNLPGNLKYDPRRPRVYRVRKDGSTIAADLFIYIDDLRNSAPSERECWKGAHQVCCRITWFGMQDAPRKKNFATLTPRAWAGTIVHTDNGVVTVLVSEEKWEKTKKWIKWVLDHVDDKEGISHKELERCRGFLIYVSRTYLAFKPFLRGLHKSIEIWRGDKDEDGWKIAQMKFELEDGIGRYEAEDREQPPEKISPVPRLKRDFEALQKLTKAEAPPKVIKRREKVAKVLYGFGDASGKGFGFGIEVDGVLHSSFGQWSAAVEGKHSNYKELRNLVNAVKRAYSEGLLKGAELYLFTDNFVAECTYYNGGSNRNKDLDDLIFQLWEMQMHEDFSLFVYHVAGTRMISSGVDGLSRGDKGEGINQGKSVLEFIPIHLNPLERSVSVEKWVRSWWDPSLGELELLQPEGWYSKAMEKGNFMWMVAPAAGDAAVEQLCAHIHGRPENTHLFVIPRLCTSHYRKQLLKACDIVLTIDCIHDFWNKDMHEPLLLGIYLPLLPPEYRYRPWTFKHTKLVEELHLQVRRMQSTSESIDWNILRKFLLQTREIPTLPHDLARSLLQVKAR